MTHSFQPSSPFPARKNTVFAPVFGADDAFAAWLRASLRARFLQRLIGRAPAGPHLAHKKTAGDAEASWTVCLDRGANLPRRRLSILSDQGAAPAMRIESFRAETFYAQTSYPQASRPDAG